MEDHQNKQGFSVSSEPLKSLEKNGKTIEKNNEFIERQKGKEIQWNPKNHERKIRAGIMSFHTVLFVVWLTCIKRSSHKESQIRQNSVHFSDWIIDSVIIAVSRVTTSWTRGNAVHLCSISVVYTLFGLGVFSIGVELMFSGWSLGSLVLLYWFVLLVRGWKQEEMLTIFLWLSLVYSVRFNTGAILVLFLESRVSHFEVHSAISCWSFPDLGSCHSIVHCRI